MSSARENTTEKSHICCNCNRSFHSSRGLKQHQRSCQSRNNTPTDRESTETIEDSQFSTKTLISADEPSTQSVQYIWGKYKDHEFEKNLSQVYEIVVFWRKILFLLPSGKAGRKFIGEVSRLMSEWLHDSPLKDIAFKAIMVMPSLLLQKPSQKSKSKDHLRALERRLELWESGEVVELLTESVTIQENLKAASKTTFINKISKKFTRETRKGNVHNAMKLLTNNVKNGILPRNKKTLEQLKQKHPQQRDADPEIMLPDKPEEIHPIKFDSNDAENVRKVALKTRGGAGPSGLDADGWKRVFTSNQFGDSTDDLCKIFAEVIKKLCTVENQPTSLEAFLANRLIPLDKNPGLRPIGVGEVLRRIAGKVIVSHLKEDVIQSVGSLQVCAGQDAGCEPLIHAMRTIYEDQSGEAVLLVDTSNAFNSINKNVFLHNVEVICSSVARYVKNCYSVNSRLFIISSGEIQSMEGTTQDDPAAMVIYAVAIIPLILMLVEIRMQDNNHTKAAAYADDLTVAGPIDQIRIWWNTLCRLGPKFGYFPEGSKSCIIEETQKNVLKPSSTTRK